VIHFPQTSPPQPPFLVFSKMFSPSSVLFWVHFVIFSTRPNVFLFPLRFFPRSPTQSKHKLTAFLMVAFFPYLLHPLCCLQIPPFFVIYQTLFFFFLMNLNGESRLDFYCPSVVEMRFSRPLCTKFPPPQVPCVRLGRSHFLRRPFFFRQHSYSVFWPCFFLPLFPHPSMFFFK